MNKIKLENFFTTVPKECVHKEWQDCLMSKDPFTVLRQINSLILSSCKNLAHIKTLPRDIYVENLESIGIHPSANIEPGVTLKGPCYIGKDVSIRQGAYIREGSYLSEGVIIGHASEVKKSLLLPFSSLPHFNYVGDSIVGAYANLGAGVKVANVRLDRAPVSVYSGGQKWSSGLKKLGALIGERVMIGCNSVVNPGTLIYPHSTFPPLSNLSGTCGEPL